MQSDTTGNDENSEGTGQTHPVSRRGFLGAATLFGLLTAGAGSATAQTSTEGIQGTYDHYHDVTEYGATPNDGNDDSAAFQAAVDDISAAGGGVLYIPEGDYRIGNQITSDRATWKLAIVGDGQGVSNVHCTNSDGVFKFSHSGGRGTQTTVRELSFFATGPSRGAAIDVSMAEGGNRHNRSHVFQNVEMRGVDAGTDYFDYGIKGFGLWRPLFLNVVFSGPFGPNNEYDRPPATTGLQANGSYAPSFQHCYSWSAKRGYHVKSEETRRGPEDCAFYRSFAVEDEIGIDVETVPDEPQLVVDACHVNCDDIGIRLKNRKYFQITNNLLYGPTTENEYTDVLLDSSFGGVVTDNIFHQPFNPDRTGVKIEGNSYRNTISNNFFNASGTAISVADSVLRTEVIDNKFQMSGRAVDTKIVDESPDLIFDSPSLRAVGLAKTEAQSVPDCEWTEVVWDEKEYQTRDRDSSLQLWTDGEAVVIPDNQAIHQVRLSASVLWADDNSGTRHVTFKKNGEKNFFGNDGDHQRASVPKGKSCEPNDSEQTIESAIVPVDPDDKLRVDVKHSAGDSLELDPAGTWFCVEVLDG